MAPTSKGKRQEHPDGGARHVHVEVADLGQPIAGERPDDGNASRNAGGRSHELKKCDKEHLREIGKPRLATVVLQVRVGSEARDAVEAERRLHVGDAVRIQRQVACKLTTAKVASHMNTFEIISESA